MQGIVVLIILFTWCSLLFSQDYESVIENAQENSQSETFSIMNYLVNPISLKKIKLHQLYEFPFLSTEKAESIFRWINHTNYISADRFRDYLDDDALYYAMRPFLTFDKADFLKLTSYISENSNRTGYIKLHFSGKHRKHEIYLRQIRTRDNKTNNYFSYVWKNDNIQFRAGDFNIKSPLRLINGSSSYFRAKRFNDDAIYLTKPQMRTNSSALQLSGMAALYQNDHQQLIFFGANNHLAVKMQEYRIIDFYSNPFTEVEPSPIRDNTHWQVYGISWWVKWKKSISTQCWYCSQTQKNKIHNLLGPSPELYLQKSRQADIQFWGVGLYYYNTIFQQDYETLFNEEGKFSLVLSHAFILDNGGQFTYNYFYYSPYLYQFQSRSILSFDEIPYNMKGFTLTYQLTWSSSSSKNRLSFSSFFSSAVVPLNYYDCSLQKTSFSINYDFILKPISARFKLYRKVTEYYTQRHRQYISSVSLKTNLSKKSYVIIGNKFAFTKEPAETIDIAYSCRFHYKGNAPLLFESDWIIFNINRSPFPFYEQEISYYPGIEWLRLTNNGFKFSMQLKWQSKNYIIGIKFRKIWKYYKEKLIKPANYIWFYSEIFS